MSWWCGVHLVKPTHDVWTVCLCENHCLSTTECSKMFMGIISGKPSRDFTHPPGIPMNLKGLLHMLNAIISPTTADLYFLLWFYFSFCFAKGLAKCKFVGIWWVPNIVYLDPLNSNLLNLSFCYFLMFLVSFCILVFCRSLRENGSFKGLAEERTNFLMNLMEYSIFYTRTLLIYTTSLFSKKIRS
jgi:hypothetical protein